MTDNNDDDDSISINDKDLANLLAEYNEIENIQCDAQKIAVFYKSVRKYISPAITSSGEIHDAALELTREWMTYIMVPE